MRVTRLIHTLRYAGAGAILGVVLVAFLAYTLNAVVLTTMLADVAGATIGAVSGSVAAVKGHLV